ncbi:MAG: hypothetical protein NZ839_05310 [Endomicrobia bacterium]|nr:hypothetical protein [Endomicrobiia bacterium]
MKIQMKLMEKYLVVILGIIFFSNNFLKANISSLFDVGVAARPLGMGCAFTAISDDASSVFWNPAGIVKVERIELCGNYNLGYLDIKNYFLCLGYSLPFISFGLGIVQRTIDDIEKTNQTDVLGKFSYNDRVVIIVVSKNIFNLISLGIKGKFLSQEIDAFKSNGFGIDIGILTLKKLPLPIQVGLNFSDIISLPMKGTSYWDNTQDVEEHLSFKIRAGIKGNLNIFTPSLDLEIVPSESNIFRIYFGLEKQIRNIFTIRAGIKKQDLENIYSILDGISFGGSISFKKFSLDYALINSESLGFTHSFSLNLRM